MAGYGVDVLDPAVTPRRVAVLLRGLPPHARRGGELWSTEAELLARLVDEVSVLTYVTARAAGAKNWPKPRPLPRPRSAAARTPAPAPAPRAAAEPGTVKHGTWADAILALAASPGFEVTTDG